MGLKVKSMLDPNCVPRGPYFEYFAESPALIGVLGQPAWIDRFGSLVSEDLELMFFLGDELQQYPLRSKRLRGDRLPIVRTSCSVGGIRYDFVYFSSSVDEVANVPCLHFVSVTIVNETGRIQACPLAVACRPLRQGRISTMDPGCTYRMQDGKAIMEENILYKGPSGGHLLCVRDCPYDSRFSGLSMHVLPDTPILWQVYEPVLTRGERKRYDFIVPSPYLSMKDPDVLALLDLSCSEAYEEKTAAYWDSFLQSGARIEVQEDRVVHGLAANQIYGYLLRPGLEWIENSRIWDEVFVSCLGVMALDVLGYFEEAKSVLMRLMEEWDLHAPAHPKALMERCQILWAMGYHTKVTRDMGFARIAVHQLWDCWVRMDRGDDGGQPPAIYWRVLGAEGGAWLAEYIGEQNLASKLRGFGRDSMGELASFGSEVNHDWLVFLALGAFDHRKEIVDPWMDEVRDLWMSEGVLISREGELLPAATAMLVSTCLGRGEDDLALDAFYSMLLHTSSCHVGVDSGLRPWGERSTMFPVPQRAFSHLMVLTIRNMLVREEGTRLHLLSSVSPEWLKPGVSLRLRSMPTRFGPLHLTIDCKRHAAEILLETAFFEKPSELTLHLPWFVNLKSAQSGGKKLQVRENSLLLEPESQLVRLRWDRRNIPVSFERISRRFETEFERRYLRFQFGGGHGFCPEPDPLLGRDERMNRYQEESSSERKNLARVARVHVAEQPSRDPSLRLLHDGDIHGQAWSSGPGSPWILLELEERCKVEAIRIHMALDSVARCRYDVSVSSDGRSWRLVAQDVEQDPSRNPSQETWFSPQDALFVRISWKEARPDGIFHLTEVEVIRASI